MKVTDFIVKLVPRSEVRDFIEHWHYSKTINGVISDYCFGLYYNDTLIGAMIYGKLGMANAWKKYGDAESEVIELRRLCCIDNTPKNTESYFIGLTIRWLKKNTKIKHLVSYADSNHGHSGVIYKATNFSLLGMTSGGKMILRLSDNRLFHDKAIRTKYKGELKPFAKKLRDQLESGEAVYEQTKGKYIYYMRLK